MILFFLLSQINTGTGLDPILNALFVDYGALPTLLIVVAVLLIVTYRNQLNASTERVNVKTETTEALNKLAVEQTEKLNTVNNEFRAYQISAERALGTLEGRADELSKLVKHQQDKYEEKERVWNKERAELVEKIDKLTERIETMEAESNGKSIIIQGLELERTNLEAQLKDKDSELERERRVIANLTEGKTRLENIRQEQVRQIESLGRELMDAKNVAVATPELPPQEMAASQDTMDNGKE